MKKKEMFKLVFWCPQCYGHDTDGCFHGIKENLTDDKDNLVLFHCRQDAKVIAGLVATAPYFCSTVGVKGAPLKYNIVKVMQ